MDGAPDSQWYLEHSLADVMPLNDLPHEHPASLDHPIAGPAGQWSRWWDARRSDDEPVRTAATQGFVLATSQLTALGVTRSSARHAVSRRRWSAPVRGVVGVVDVRSDDRHVSARRSHALLAAAGALTHPGHVVSDRSAGILHGLPTLATPARAQLTAPEDAGLGVSSVHRFGAALDARSVTSWFGVAVTDVARTLVDLARHGARDGIMAADAALRERLVTAAAIDAALADAVGWPGVRQARAVLAQACGLAESPLESLTRWALHRSGFPEPELQVVIGSYRVDFLLRRQRLIIEADGRSKYTGDELWREKRREHALRADGFAVERVVWSDIVGGWWATERRLWRAIDRQ